MAKDYWGGGESRKPVVLTGLIAYIDIDWKNTVIMNTSPDFQEEKEIRVLKGSPILLLSIDDKIINKEYMA